MTARRLAIGIRALPGHRDPLSGAQIRGLIDAAAGAGFTDVCTGSDHLAWAIADDMSVESFVSYHRDRGLGIATMEVLFDWVDADRATVAAACVPVLDAAALVGAGSVIATTLETPSLPPQAATGLRQLCDLAAERGLRISFEFLPFAAVSTIGSALRLFDAVEADNLGLVLDAWHWFRAPGGPDLDAVRAIPPELIDIVQLGDAPAVPEADPVAECMYHRLLPGEGAIDIAGMVAAVHETGAAPLFAGEVFASALATRGPAAMAERIHATCCSVLDEAERRHGRAD